MVEDGGVNPVRTLVIMRHAKAATGTDCADLDRPLTPRGRSDAAIHLAGLGLHGPAHPTSLRVPIGTGADTAP